MNSTPIPTVLLYNFLFCTAVAVFLRLMVPAVGQYGFYNNFVHSQAIGNTVCVISITSSLLLSRFIDSRTLIRAITILIVTPIGIYFGVILARWWLGINVNTLDWLSDSNQLLITLAIAVVASGIFNWILGNREKVLRLELTASEERRRAEAANHAMLRAQLDPHMLFNTLANLRALIETDTGRALGMLDQLDGFLRATLRSSQQVSSTLEQEFAVLSHYLGLMQVRFGERLRFETDLPDNCRDHSVPALLLQPLVENAIRHGIEPQLAGGVVIITASLDNHAIRLTVRDDGVGYTPTGDSTDTNGGFGLRNIRQRLYNTYGDDAGMQISTNDTGGTTVTITIPAERNDP